MGLDPVRVIQDLLKHGSHTLQHITLDLSHLLDVVNQVPLAHNFLKCDTWRSLDGLLCSYIYPSLGRVELTIRLPRASNALLKQMVTRELERVGPALPGLTERGFLTTTFTTASLDPFEGMYVP